jgi:hypothetical protein
LAGLLDAVLEGLFCVRLTHFYHVFADGDWETPAREHFGALEASGLMGELDSIFLGVVGSRENRVRVARELPGVVVAEADEGWEQVTLKELHDFCQKDDGFVFYAHTKGAWSRSELARLWRVAMTHDTVTLWRECVHALKRVQTAGPFWLRSKDPEHVNHESFFGGNFWWARSDYVATLKPVGVGSRFDAEGWIGLGRPSVKIMREGFPMPGNFEVPHVAQ